MSGLAMASGWRLAPWSSESGLATLARVRKLSVAGQVMKSAG